MMPRDDKNTSVFVDGDLPHAESRRGGEFFSRKERIDRKGWKRVRLGNILSYEQPYPYIVHSTEYSDTGTPVLTPGKSFILGHTPEKDGICRASIGVPKILFDDFLTISKLVQFDFKVKSSAVKILSTTSDAYNLNFVFYAMSCLKFEVTDHQRHWIERFSKLEIEIPMRKEQDRIAETIGSVDTCIKNIQSLIAKYEAIKKATVNLLLKPKAGWRCVKLGDVFEVKVGGDLDLPHYSPNKTLDCRYEIVSNSLANHGHYGYTSLPKFPGDSITVTGRGNVGHAEYRQEPFDAIVRIVILSPNCSQVCSKFVAELINAKDTFLIESTGIPQLTAPQISSTSIALPPLDEQRRIVGILDSIDGTINGLKSQLAKAKDIKQGMMSYFFG